MKKVCFFGIYDREYPRNKVIISGLEENGYEVLHCNVNPRVHKGLKKYWLLAKEAGKLNGANFDLVWVAFPGHTCVWLAWILFPKKILIFDTFLSLYEANVSDRKVHKPGSFDAIKDWFLDWYGIRLARIVTLDTNEQIKMFKRKYGLDERKAIRIFLSSAIPIKAREEKKRAEKFVIHFHGSFIPLHGVEYIVAAAKLIEKEEGIYFKLVGGGQQLSEMRELAATQGLNNIEFLGRLADYNDVLKYLEVGDIMLGMFAAGGRGHWIIPNKIFEGMVFGKPIVTADTPAIRELLTDRENVLLCRAGNAEDLATKIMELYKNNELRRQIGNGAAKFFEEHLTPKMLVSQFLADLHGKL